MSFSFVQITDHHLRASADDLTYGYSTAHSLRCVLRHVAEHVASRIDFIVSTGDVVEPPSDAAYENACALLGLRGRAPAPGPRLVRAEGLRDLPTYFVPGNHDDREAFVEVAGRREPASAACVEPSNTLLLDSRALARVSPRAVLQKSAS